MKWLEKWFVNVGYVCSIIINNLINYIINLVQSTGTIDWEYSKCHKSNVNNINPKLLLM